MSSFFNSDEIPGLDYNDDNSARQRANRRQLVRDVLEWFSADGATYVEGTRYNRGYWIHRDGYRMTAPANPERVIKNISDFTAIEIAQAPHSREEWLAMSGVNGYWYH